jgi:hypothetical protein
MPTAATSTFFPTESETSDEVKEKGMMMGMKGKKGKSTKKHNMKKSSTPSPTSMEDPTPTPSFAVNTEEPTPTSSFAINTEEPDQTPTPSSATFDPTVGDTMGLQTDVPGTTENPTSALATDNPSLTTDSPSSATVQPTTSAPTAGDRWNVDLDLRAVPAEYQNLFTTAARKWETVNVGDIPDFTVTADYAGMSSCSNLPPVIDDMYICAFVQPIDGPSNVLGYGQPQLVRPDTLIPAAGQMIFDSDDLADSLAPVIVRIVIPSLMD